MADPLAIIGTVSVAFSAASGAWAVVQDGLDFKSDSEALLIRLELARARFDTWADTSGLRSQKSEGIDQSLVPYEILIARTLQHLGSVFEDTDKLRHRYGLVISQDEDELPMKSRSLATAMRKSLRAAGLKVKAKDDWDKFQATQTILMNKRDRSNPDNLKKLRWGLKDKVQFEEFVTLVESLVGSLQDLLRESQQRSVQANLDRFNITLIGRISDPTTLRLLQNATAHQTRSQLGISSLAQLKTLSLESPAQILRLPGRSDIRIDLIDPKFRRRQRFMTCCVPENTCIYLYEKKEYDRLLPIPDKALLRERIQRLVALLSVSQNDTDLRTMQIVGYVDDVALHCWWTIFRVPSSPQLLRAAIDHADHLEAHDLLTLQAQFQIPWRPPLEQRYILAQRLARTLAKLYGSDWMHKGISSNNIVFNEVDIKGEIEPKRDVTTAFLQGYGYSRQQTEAQTIDKGKDSGNIEAALYRDPNYQGDAATGYKIQYDIYSFGLVLFEIAIWGSLKKLLVKPRNPKPSDPPMSLLSPEMTFFHREEALQLKACVMRRVLGELPYRVGTQYMEVVKWCLNAGEVIPSCEYSWEPAVEFYNNVVVPLDALQPPKTIADGGDIQSAEHNKIIDTTRSIESMQLIA